MHTLVSTNNIIQVGVAFMLKHCNNDPSHLSHYDNILSTDICPGSVAVVQDGHGGAVLRVLDSSLTMIVTINAVL